MLDIAQAYHAVGQQFQRPALPSIGSLATGQMDQLSFSFAIQAPPFGAFSWKTAGESHLQLLLHKPLLNANDGAAADGERFGNLPIGRTRFALTLITHQQDTSHQIVFGWRSARLRHRFQKAALLIFQSHWIAVIIGSHT